MKVLHHSISQLIIICLSLLSLTACSYSPSNLKSSYNNLGKEYVRELKQLADYTPEQNKKLDIYGKELMQWHRKNRLPAYASVMQSLSSKLDNPQEPSRTDLNDLIKLMAAYPNFHESQENNTQLAQLASNLSDEQLAQLSKHIEDGGKDLSEYFQTSWETRKRDNVRMLSDTFSYLKVNLSNKQLDIVRKHVNYQRDLKDLFIASSDKWNNTLITLLSKRHEQGFVKKFAHHLSNDNLPKRLLQEAPAEAKHNDNISINMYKELFASLTKQQKSTLAAQFKSISKTLTELMEG